MKWDRLSNVLSNVRELEEEFEKKFKLQLRNCCHLFPVENVGCLQSTVGK